MSFHQTPVSIGDAEHANGLVAGKLALDDPQNPHSWSKRKRLYLSAGVVLAAFTPTCQASIFVASVPGVVDHFGVTINESLLGISLCAIGFAVGPALASTASELFGRRWVLKGSLFFCLVFNVVAASAPTFRTLLVGRTLGGTIGSASVTALIGLGPLIGEAVVDQRDWRWTMWLIVMLLTVCLLWLLPMRETFAPEILRQKRKRQGISTEKRNVLVILIQQGLWRPMHMLFVEPVVFLCASTVAVSQVILFVDYVAVPIVLQRIYHFTNYQVGLSFLAMFSGSLIGLVVVKVCELRIVEVRRKKAEAEGRSTRTEDRLYPAMIGGIIQPVALFWFAWSSRASVHWIVPLLGILVWSTSFTLTQLGMPIYKNHYYAAAFGSSALAPDLMFRYILSSFFPLFMPNMIDRLTVGWAMSFFGFLSIPMAYLPFYLFSNGERLMERSRYLKKKATEPLQNPAEREQPGELIHKPAEFDEVTVGNH